MSSELPMYLSSKESQVLFLNYKFQRNGANCNRFRCCNRKCGATLFFNGTEVRKGANQHNHPELPQAEIEKILQTSQLTDVSLNDEQRNELSNEFENYDSYYSPDETTYEWREEDKLVNGTSVENLPLDNKLDFNEIQKTKAKKRTTEDSIGMENSSKRQSVHKIQNGNQNDVENSSCVNYYVRHVSCNDLMLDSKKCLSSHHIAAFQDLIRFNSEILVQGLYHPNYFINK